MVYPWLFDEYNALRPLKDAAEITASRSDWGLLYNREQMLNNDIPVAAAVYWSDMYVDIQFSEECARNIPGIKLYVTNEYKHNGIGDNGEYVLNRLLGMLHGDVACH